MKAASTASVVMTWVTIIDNRNFHEYTNMDFNVHTSLKKVAHLLAGSLFHVDNDSGIQHLAGALDVLYHCIWANTSRLLEIFNLESVYSLGWITLP